MESIRIAADNNDLDLRPETRVVGLILVGGSDASAIDLHDALTVTGDAKLSLKCPAADTREVMFKDKGISFKTGISANITGTGAVAFLLIE